MAVHAWLLLSCWIETPDDPIDSVRETGCEAVGFRDADGDGHGDPVQPSASCVLEEGEVASGDDCDDGDPDVYPGAPELCDGEDNDCDGAIDDELPTWYADDDQDGVGDGNRSESTCSPPEGWVTTAGDCDDGDPWVHPGAFERCNGLDDDCDGGADDVGAVTFESGEGFFDLADSLGTEAEPGSWTNNVSGTLTFCEGTFYVSVETTADLVVRGLDGHEVLLSGADQTRVLAGQGAQVELQDLVLTRGFTDGDGGCLLCQSAGRFVLEGVEIRGCQAERGGAVALLGCEGVLNNTTLTESTATVGGGCTARRTSP